MVNLAIVRANCLGCGAPIATVELEGFPAPRPRCSDCVLKDAEEDEAKLPKLIPHYNYKVIVMAYVEARYEGDFSRVKAAFTSTFRGWTRLEDDEEHALFENGVTIGPRREMGYSWHAVQVT